MLKKLAKGVGIPAVVVVGGGAGTFQYMNSTPPQLKEPNYFAWYKEHDRTPEGKVGIISTGLIMPEDMRAEDFYNLSMKSKQYIPWPFNMNFEADTGVVLLDPERFYEFQEFQPESLVDAWGRDADLDGVPYVDKYRAGDEESEIVWVPPRKTRYMDLGYFLLTTRGGGMPTVSQKGINKAALYWYGKGMKQKKIPHERGSREIFDKAMARIEAKYGPIPHAQVTAEHFGMARATVYDLLDQGIDTLVFASARPAYSHHEEFNGSVKHTMHYVHEWEEQNGKHIKVVMIDQLGDYPVMWQTWVNMLRDRLDTLPRDASVKVVMSVHGMAWDRVPHEAWIEVSPKYVQGTLGELKKALESYGFPRTEIVQSQDHFADPYNNPDGNYLATNTAFWDGINDDFDYVINVPIEFMVENTDTMFSHAMYNFAGFEEFDRYETRDYPDWSIPYTMEYVVDGTTVIYNGVPASKYNGPIVDAYVQALDALLSLGLEPVPQESVTAGIAAGESTSR